MLGDVTAADEIYIVCGYTDYPRSLITDFFSLLATTAFTHIPIDDTIFPATYIVLHTHHLHSSNPYDFPVPSISPLS